MEGVPGFEPGHKGFADPCLTTWLYSRMGRSMGLEPTNAGATIRCVNPFATTATFYTFGRGSRNRTHTKGFGDLRSTVKLCPYLTAPAYLVPRTGLEPVREKLPTDFKSVASAYSATPALIMKNGREDRIRTCDPLVPSQVLYQAELLPDDGHGCPRIDVATLVDLQNGVP